MGLKQTPHITQKYKTKEYNNNPTSSIRPRRRDRVWCYYHGHRGSTLSYSLCLCCKTPLCSWSQYRVTSLSYVACFWLTYYFKNSPVYESVMMIDRSYIAVEFYSSTETYYHSITSPRYHHQHSITPPRYQHQQSITPPRYHHQHSSTPSWSLAIVDRTVFDPLPPTPQSFL